MGQSHPRFRTNPLVELLILGAIALFVLGRLYVALGSDQGPPKGRTRIVGRRGRNADAEGEVAEPAAESRPGEIAGVLQRPVFTGAGAGGLEEIYHADNSFSPKEFLQGAKAAYEMIVNAFARGDTATLKPLLDDEVFETWAAAIAARAQGGPGAPTLLRLKSAEIDDAELSTGIARIDVLFQAELGEADRVRTAREVWSFEREVRSADPNWKLAAVSIPD